MATKMFTLDYEHIFPGKGLEYLLGGYLGGIVEKEKGIVQLYIEVEYEYRHFGEHTSTYVLWLKKGPRTFDLLKFTLMDYPSCCAAKLFHDFSHYTTVSLHANKENLFNALYAAIDDVDGDETWLSNRRLIATFVQPQFHPETELQFPLVYEFLKWGSESFKSIPMFNTNSDNTCHFTEVIIREDLLPATVFNEEDEY